ncbi:MAG: GNAT family acetyltransferase [Oceanospirillaceae bacterium]|nr:GNAT family acetyltransferase [Oceanospirillaceae bacterium]|tara:strand:+ start:6467 stop:6895 length:429 start_codon:yes stop_codon:yes gene_type:complete
MTRPIIRPFHTNDTEAVVELWQTCGLTRPWNNPRKDIERKLSVQPELFLVGLSGNQVIASAMAGYDGHRGSVYYLAVDPHHQRIGIGSEIMRHIERLLTDLGCPKINLQIRSSNLDVKAFYENQNYQMDDVISLGKRLIEDE